VRWFLRGNLIWVYMIRGSSLLNWLVWSRLSIRKKGSCKFGRISNDVFMECPSSHYPAPSNLMPKMLQIWQFDQNFACKVVHKRGYFLRIRVTTFLLLFPAYICYLYIFFLFPSHYPFFLALRLNLVLWLSGRYYNWR